MIGQVLDGRTFAWNWMDGWVDGWMDIVGVG